VKFVFKCHRFGGGTHQIFERQLVESMRNLLKNDHGRKLEGRAMWVLRRPSEKFCGIDGGLKVERCLKFDRNR
jgi:hypothetical protein